MKFLMDRYGVVINGKEIGFKEIDPRSGGVWRVVQYTGKVNYLDPFGNFICPKDYDDGRPFVNGVARVKKNGLWGFINLRGEEICTCQFKLLKDLFHGYAGASDGEGWLLIDKTGKPYNEERYDMIYYLHSGTLMTRRKGKNCFIDEKGRITTQYCATSDASLNLSRIEREFGSHRFKKKQS